MKNFSSRFGTMTQRFSPGLLAGVAGGDEEDAYIGTLMVSIDGPAGANPNNPQGQSNFWENLPGAVQKIIAVKQTWDVTEINKELIRQGKPPLSVSQMQSISPTAYVGLTSATQNLLIYGGGALLAVYLLKSLAKR